MSTEQIYSSNHKSGQYKTNMYFKSCTDNSHEISKQKEVL